MSESQQQQGNNRTGDRVREAEADDNNLTALLAAERVRAVEEAITAELLTFELQMADKTITKDSLFRSLTHVESRMYRRLRDINTLDADTRRLSEFIYRKQRICDRWAIVVSRFR